MPKVYIDIGSYDGAEIRLALDRGYEVHAFEPNPRMRPALAEFGNRAIINHAAAWQSDGTAVLHAMRSPELETNEQGLSLIDEKTNIDREKGEEVPTINIGRYLRELDKDIDVIKVDAEGSEYVILESILSEFDPRRIGRWYVEDHSHYIDDPRWHAHKLSVQKLLKTAGVEIQAWANQDIWT